MKPRPRTAKMLDLSTCHVPGPDPDWGEVRVSSHEYGWTVFVNPGDRDEEKWARGGLLGASEKIVPDWLGPIYDWAIESDCLIINFDCDSSGIYEVSDLETLAGSRSGFPVYDW